MLRIRLHHGPAAIISLSYGRAPYRLEFCMYRSLKIPFAIVLALLLLPHVPASAAPAGQEIDVMLSNFSFDPNMLQLQRNTAYTLHLMNSASGGHAFSAPE